MMLDNASRCGADDRMVARHMTDYPADSGAFQAAFCSSDARKPCKGRHDQESDNLALHEIA